MTRYTYGSNKNVVICDQCRKDLPQGESVYSISNSKVADGYTSRDYDKSEIILCLECANTVSQILAITGTRYADSLIMQEAA